MLNDYNLGDRVYLWPTLPNVQDGEMHPGRFMAPEGREVVLDDYWCRRILDGSVTPHNPRPAPAPVVTTVADVAVAVSDHDEE